jgi:hypothetical protein
MIALPLVDRPDLFDTAMPDRDVAVPRVRSFVQSLAVCDVDKVPIA